ncbi:Protein prune 2 [Desmophyllum pertusum]|uniref:Protein prune 2 n=1 Tax=Desmophyllum pertusum TaxID=174260 RepID=A0A9W9YPR5_9CNID|nr:Protein prune 2 [Desmophyllum pertusum]
MDCLFLYAQKFTEEKVKSETFVVTIHAVRQRRSRLRSRKWATEFYKFLKDRYQNRLTRCVLYKPSFKLRALVILSWPFFSNNMKEKIFIVKSHRDFAKTQGLPESDSVKKT